VPATSTRKHSAIEAGKKHALAAFEPIRHDDAGLQLQIQCRRDQFV
jgi:hypothetical protein